MPVISQSTVLDEVKHVLASGTGTLNFAVEGENNYYTWRGSEEADWQIEDVDRVENTDEDLFVTYPEGKYFVCEIEANGEENNNGPVRCYSQ